MSRAGSRVSVALLAAAVGDVGGITTDGGSGAVPVPARGAVAAAVRGATLAAAAGAAAGGMPAKPAGLPALPRIGGGGGPDLLACGLAGADAGATALSAGEVGGGWGAGGWGGLVYWVRVDSALDGVFATAGALARLEHYKEISDGG